MGVAPENSGFQPKIWPSTDDYPVDGMGHHGPPYFKDFQRHCGHPTIRMNKYWPLYNSLWWYDRPPIGFDRGIGWYIIQLRIWAQKMFPPNPTFAHAQITHSPKQYHIFVTRG